MEDTEGTPQLPPIYEWLLQQNVGNTLELVEHDGTHSRVGNVTQVLWRGVIQPYPDHEAIAAILGCKDLERQDRRHALIWWHDNTTVGR